MDAIEQRLTGPGSPFQLREWEENGTRLRVFSRGPETLPDVLARARSLNERVFIVTINARMTYAQALTLGGNYARGLRGLYGVAAGSRVAILMENRVEWVLAFIALAMSGAVPVVMNTAGSVAGISSALDAAKCDLILTDATSAGRLLESVEPRPQIIAGITAKLPESSLRVRIEDVIEAGRIAPASAFERPQPDDAALIAFTSGTTGQPKGALFTHRNVVTGLMNMLLGGALVSSRNNTGDARVRAPRADHSEPSSLLFAPFGHVGGYSQLLLMPFIGGKIVLPSSQNPWQAAELISQEKVRSMSGATPDLIREVLRAGRTTSDISSLASFNIHGSALHSNLIEEITSALPAAVIWTGYGMTETNGSVCVACGTELAVRPTTAGRPLPSVDLQILDEEGTAVPSGGVGEVWVRGAMLMREYCGAPAATGEVIKEGWFRTRDVGRLDAEGFLHVVDRESDIVATSRGAVSYTDIERIMVLHPAVAEAAVAASDEASHNGALLIAVVPRRDAAVTAAELNAFVGANLQKLGELWPRVVLCTGLPRTPSGKVNRRELSLRLAPLQGETSTVEFFSGATS